MLRGVYTPVITVFDKDGNIDYEGNKRVVERLINAGVDGILFLGSIGEFFALSLEEKKKFITFAVSTVNKRTKVLIGTGGTAVDEVVSLTQFANNAGADAAVVISPYYFLLNEDSLYSYYAQVAESVSMPVVLYNFPDRTGVNLSPKLIRRLAEDFSNIVGIKDTVDNISHTRKIIQQTSNMDKDFSVLSGFDEYFLPNLLAGGSGILTGLTNVAPEVFISLMKAYDEKHFEEVQKLQEKINILMKLYDVSEPFIGSIKTAVSMFVENISTAPRKPFSDCSEEQRQRVVEILKKAEVL
jgi:4-hydroxy-tetrahydrodipicolinate synthase